MSRLPSPTFRWLPALAAAAVLLASEATPATAAATPVYRPGEVVVQFRPDVSAAEQANAARAAGAIAGRPAGAGARVLHVADGETVGRTIRQLKAQPGVVFAAPNPIARASLAFIPNDRGRGGFAGWRSLQWNFLATTGVNAPEGWAWMLRRRAPGGRGATVAVLDTGVAHRNSGRYRRSPDFRPGGFVPGYDFIARDRHPDDPNGHGTLIAGIIAERTGNRIGLTGIAYGAQIMPVRVLNNQGLGDAAAIASGIRFAASHGADVINLSLEFDSSVTAAQIPGILRAIAFARRRGAVVVGAAGNEAQRTIAYPARARGVISVSATTEHVCQAEYSNYGPGLDLVAPGGGRDSRFGATAPHCVPHLPPGRTIFQVTYSGGIGRFGYPSGYEGTSMAAPHVSGVAALVIAAARGRISSSAVEARLKNTARELGTPGWDERYGYGMVDAGRAVAPGPARRR